MNTFRLIAVSLLISMSFSLSAFAQTTILPNPDDFFEDNISELSEKDCLYIVEVFLSQEATGDGGEPESLARRLIEEGDSSQALILGCAIKSGKIKFWMVPFFIRNILQFAINLAVLISMFMIMLGAYYHIAGALSDDKQKGKTIITYALIGLVLTVLSWTLVNILLLALTA